MHERKQLEMLSLGVMMLELTLDNKRLTCVRLYAFSLTVLPWHHFRQVQR